MDAGTQSVQKLFEGTRQVFQIPTFQRPYVWKLATQWEPLWEDVRDLVERYQEELATRGDPGKAQKETGRHFLGAVVVQRIERPFGSPETWELIDGQQRLTTLQLLLHATHEVLARAGLDRTAQHFERVVKNDTRSCTDEEVFKLWPTGGDREAFRAVMSSDDDASKFSESQIVKAHGYFTTQVREWLGDPTESEAAGRAEALAVTLLALLQLVVIQLDGSDDAFVVFETLNARGTPLLAADLVKNYVLQKAVEQNKDKDEFHRAHWQHFEELRESPGKPPWWLIEIRQGRIYRPRLDVFLNHWLVVRTHDEVKSRDLFNSFKRHVELVANDDIEPELENFVHYAKKYRELEQHPEDQTREGRFVYRWRVVQAGVLTPLLLQLFGANGGVVPVERRHRALAHLESYLVRRMVCRRTSKDYNRMFLELVGKVDANLERCDEVIAEYLVGQEADARAWPKDSELIESIAGLPLYGRINQRRIRMVLEGLEEAMRSDKAESVTAPRDLQLEHVMPRKWRDHWPLPEVDDPEKHHRAIERRERLVDTLGNLTLLAGKLNAAISNGPWDKKRPELTRHTTLFLNKRLTDEHADTPFDEDAIEARGRVLGKLACVVWPRPGTEAQ